MTFDTCCRYSTIFVAISSQNGQLILSSSMTASQKTEHCNSDQVSTYRKSQRISKIRSSIAHFFQLFRRVLVELSEIERLALRNIPLLVDMDVRCKSGRNSEETQSDEHQCTAICGQISSYNDHDGRTDLTYDQLYSGEHLGCDRCCKPSQH